MTDTSPPPISLRDALDKHLSVRSLSKSVGSLLQSRRKKINYQPYYQRNYVWDNDKATYFIESIFLGIEVQPLVLFIAANDSKTYEVIDGRQRFQTLKRFFENDFKLSAKGLQVLSALQGLNFSQLDSDFQRTFLDITLRTIEFSTIGEHAEQEQLEDQIKKEIFFRYNSGITPLKTIEVHRAKHLNDDFTALMDEEFEVNPDWLNVFKKVFFAKNTSAPTSAECQTKIRELMVMEHFPINIYATTPNQLAKIEWLYELYVEGAEDSPALFTAFQQKLGLLEGLFDALQQQEWMIYQGVYWLLVVMEQNDVNVQQFFDGDKINRLAAIINANKGIFVSEEGGFTTVTIARFNCLTEFCNNELVTQGRQAIDFTVYLKNALERPAPQKVTEAKDAMQQLEQIRLHRPDAVIKSVDDLIHDLGTQNFLIRPSYQRQEVINLKKASGIIESMLLGIPLPTIFVYRNENGVSEVVDGQQRLLAILAYMNESYRNEHGTEEQSQKHGFSLSKNIRILDKFQGQKFAQLPNDFQDKIWEFELSVVYIDSKLNSQFDPIELFIRLNTRPYPVKDDSFEMWNSYVHRPIITRIRDLVDEHRHWFYYRKDNRRMIDEELITIFAYLSFNANQDLNKVFDVVTLYNWSPRQITFSLPKVLLTNWLIQTTKSHVAADTVEILQCIDDVADFIAKLRVLVQALQQHHSPLDLRQAFDIMLGLKSKARMQRSFYIIWFLLYGLHKNTIAQQPLAIAQAVTTFLDTKKIIPAVEGCKLKDIFRENITQFWHDFN